MSAAKSPSLALICGDDEFAVKKRAKEIYQTWCDELGGMDHEIIDASVSTELKSAWPRERTPHLLRAESGRSGQQ